MTVSAGALTLPQRAPPPNEAAPTLPAAITGTPARRTVLREGRSRREIGRDAVSGEYFHRRIEEPSLVRIDDIGIELGNSSSSECRIMDDDPLSARLELRRCQSVGRGDWRVRSELVTRFSATRKSFHVRATLEAFEGDVLIRRREWDETIPRDLL